VTDRKSLSPAPHPVEPCPVRHWARVAPDRIAIHGAPHPDSTLGYRQLDARLNALCQQLEQAGLKAGDRLVAVVRGALEDVLLAWACVRTGLVFCPLNPAFPVARQAELARQLDVAACWSAGEIPTGPWQALRLDFTAERERDEERGSTT
jgi:O-succinylbenzoic acid--CoA ligase